MIFSICLWHIYINIGRLTLFIHFPWSFFAAWYDYGFKAFLHYFFCIANDEDTYWGVVLGFEYSWLRI
jgi:hypothetical protein